MLLPKICYRQSCLFTLLHKITAVVVVTFGGYRKGRKSALAGATSKLETQMFFYTFFLRLSQTKENHLGVDNPHKLD